MLQTYLEVLQTVSERYEHATALSRDPGDPLRCVYSHHPDQGSVGCAIGCLFSAEQAKQLDNHGASGWIKAVYKHSFAKSIIDGTLNVEAIGLDRLIELQSMHDSAKHIDDFRADLRAAIAVWSA